MKSNKYLLLLFLLIVSFINCGFITKISGQNQKIKVLVVASNDPDHDAMIIASKPFFEKLATVNHLDLDYTRDSKVFTETNLSNYQVFIQLHLAPFDLTQDQQFAIQHFISRGNGWIGLHAAGLTGKDGKGDGSGIDFKMEDNGNEWRWSEQWIPHTGWFLQAVTAMSSK